MRDPPERNGKADHRSLVNAGDALQLLDKSDSNIPIHPKFILAFPRKQEDVDSSIGEYDVQNWEEDRLERLLSTLGPQEYKWSPCISSSIASNVASHPMVARYAFAEQLMRMTSENFGPSICPTELQGFIHAVICASAFYCADDRPTHKIPHRPPW
jgi:hypothetical protein